MSGSDAYTGSRTITPAERSYNKSGCLGLRWPPFQAESVDLYTGVYIPIEQAKRHDSVLVDFQRRRSGENSDNDSGNKSKTAEDDGEEGVTRTSSITYNPNTIEGLRAEVTQEPGTGGKEAGSTDTQYDCKLCCLILQIKHIPFR